jgi:electron transport complex protein RnfG
MSNKVNIPVLTVSLALITGIAAALLGWVYLITLEPIAAAQQAKTNAALREVIPDFETLDQPVTNGVVVFYTGRDKDKNIVGFAGETITPKGYNGNVTVLAGLKPDGTVTTVLVTQQAETPGLGTVVCERTREQKTLSGLIKGTTGNGVSPNVVLDQFAGKQAVAGQAPWLVKKDGGTLDAVTGATITSRAVADAVFTIAEAFSKNSNQLLEEL